MGNWPTREEAPSAGAVRGDADPLAAPMASMEEVAAARRYETEAHGSGSDDGDDELYEQVRKADDVLMEQVAYFDETLCDVASADSSPVDETDRMQSSFSPTVTASTDRHEERRWQPVTGVSQSKETRQFRQDVDHILAAVQVKNSPSELDMRSCTPEFIVHEDEWLGHTSNTVNQFKLMTPLKTVALIPTNLLESDGRDSRSEHEHDISGYVRKRGGNRSHRRRYLELNGSVLSYYKKMPEKDGIPLSEEDKKACERGAINLNGVVSITPVEIKVDKEPFAIQLEATHRTWLIAMQSEGDYTRWLKSLYGVVPFAAVHPTFRRMLLLQQPEGVAGVRMVVTTSDTVGEVVERIFHCYKLKPNAALLRPYDPREFVLKVTGLRDFMVDRLRPLNEYKHVRECLLTRKTLLLIVVHESLIQETVTRSLSMHGELLSIIRPSPMLAFGAEQQPDNTMQPTTDGDDGERASASVPSLILNSEVQTPFRIKICRVANIPRPKCVVKHADGHSSAAFGDVVVCIALFDGNVPLEHAKFETASVQLTPQRDDLLSAEWQHPVWHDFDMNVCDILSTMWLRLSLVCTSGDDTWEEETLLAADVHAFQADGLLMQGTQRYIMRKSVGESAHDLSPPVWWPDDPRIDVEFPLMGSPISFNWSDPEDARDAVEHNTSDTSGADTALAELRRVVLMDPLRRLTMHQKSQLWTHREAFADVFAALPRVLSCVDWSDKTAVNDALTILPEWEKPDHPAAYMELLRGEFSNETVRAFAVSKIAMMRDTTLSLFLPQLVQAL